MLFAFWNHVIPLQLVLGHVLAFLADVPSLPASPLSLIGLSFPPLAGFPMHAKSTVNVGSGDPPRWSSKVNMAPAVH